MMRSKGTATTPDGITWYYEQEGSGPHIVLIPDGISDCHEFSASISHIASAGFTVTTFDTPGMSRSSEAPAEAYQDVTSQKLANQVIGLLDHLHIDNATFWGSSSGGATVLALASLHPSRTRSALPHEVPTGPQPFFQTLIPLDDETISQTVSDAFTKQFPADIETWNALGTDFHARLWKNYPRWVRGYGATLTPSISLAREALTKRRMDWSVGAATPTAMFVDNVIEATRCGISVRTLPGTHFPYIFDPEAFAEYVVGMTRKYL
jgi:pimeloyl-ACP methyl ester carboxylesterase